MVEPDGPSSTQTSPAATSMVTASTAVIGPNTLLTRSRRIIAEALEVGPSPTSSC
jgi:hypothetical protein